jgi:hypothetical protein
MRQRLAVATGLGLLVLSISSTGWCTDGAVTTTTDTGYAYKFNDDLLPGSGLSASDPRIQVIGHGRRDVLIRPRIAFIPELLKSVENL